MMRRLGFMEVAVEIKSPSGLSAIAENVKSRKRSVAVADAAMSPYLVARREWDERYGNLITRARNWRLIAVLCATAGLLQTVGLIALSMRAKVVPYIVAIDSLGHEVAAGPAEQSSSIDDRLKRAELFEWI